MANALEQALRTAIAREMAAYDLYTSTAKLVDSGPSRQMLLELASQERGHRARLERVLERGVFQRLTPERQESLVDRKITDSLVAVPLSEDADLQNILIVAGQREGASYDLYTALAQVADDDRTRKLFEFLADEELKHKESVEKLYEDLFYSEN